MRWLMRAIVAIGLASRGRARTPLRGIGGTGGTLALSLLGWRHAEDDIEGGPLVLEEQRTASPTYTTAASVLSFLTSHILAPFLGSISVGGLHFPRAPIPVPYMGTVPPQGKEQRCQTVTVLAGYVGRCAVPSALALQGCP